MFAKLILAVCIWREIYALILPIASVDSGQRNFTLFDGTTHSFYYTQMCIPTGRCIKSLNVDALSVLTTAEEIQILYTACEDCSAVNIRHNLMHYHHVDNQFTFNVPVNAAQVSLVSPRDLRVVDISLHACTRAEQSKCRYDECAVSKTADVDDDTSTLVEDLKTPKSATAIHAKTAVHDGTAFMTEEEILFTKTSTTTAPEHVETSTLEQIKFPEIQIDDDKQKFYIDPETGHKMRYHGNTIRELLKHRLDEEVDVILRSIDGTTTSNSMKHQRRMKRQEKVIEGELARNTVLEAGVYVVNTDLYVPKDITLTLQPGVVLRFRSGAGLIVKGHLVARGTVQQPIHLVAVDERQPWMGVTIDEQYNVNAVRLSSPASPREGHVQEYNGTDWAYVCDDAWTIRGSHVMCALSGYRMGAIQLNTVDSPSPSLLTSGAQYSRQSIQCTGNEPSPEQCARVPRTRGACTRPAFVQCQGSASVIGDDIVSPATVLHYVNISSTLTGVRITASRLPTISHVIIRQSGEHALTISTTYDSARTPLRQTLLRLQLVANRGHGLLVNIRYPTDVVIGEREVAQILIVESIIASNGASGIVADGYGSVSVYATSLFGNAHSGLWSRLDRGMLLMDTVLVDSNAQHAVLVQSDESESETGGSDIAPNINQLQIDLHNVNITGHWWSSAVLVSHETSILNIILETCVASDNYDGVIDVALKDQSSLQILNSTITHNRGTIIRVQLENGGNRVRIVATDMSLNLLSNHSDAQAIVDIANTNGELQILDLENNHFMKNTVQDVVRIDARDSTPTIANNRFTDNLGLDGFYLSHEGRFQLRISSPCARSAFG